MKVIQRDKNKPRTISSIPQGGLYRTENGASIYMKMKGTTTNAVAIETGFTFNHKPDMLAKPVRGAFVEGHDKEEFA